MCVLVVALTAVICQAIKLVTTHIDRNVKRVTGLLTHDFLNTYKQTQWLNDMLLLVPQAVIRWKSGFDAYCLVDGCDIRHDDATLDTVQGEQTDDMSPV